jgi:hypothetical protein
VHRVAGIVAGDMQLAECALGFRQCINDGLLDCDVNPHRRNAFVGTRERVRRFFDCIFLDVGLHWCPPQQAPSR